MTINFKPILVANRGVVARRIISTCNKLNIPVIGLYETKDDLKNIKSANYFHKISEKDNIYKSIPKLIEIAKIYDADIHPGYGFLSENYRFAKECEENSVNFIGVKSKVLEKTGNKSFCKDILSEQDIKTIKSIKVINDDFSNLTNELTKIPFPLLVKPSFGGGGIGMEIIEDLDKAIPIIKSAYENSKRQFGKGDLLIEQYFDNAKHIEVQILADKEKNIMHLFERECSIQRRHQKIVEEAPSQSINETERKKILEISEKIARILEIDNIATVEFLYHKGEFYFLEVNPRLQVEHAVTEEITGIDLVETQIKISNGINISEFKKFQKINGYSIEARVYSEDPETFLPYPGKIEHLDIPYSKNLRVDLGISQGTSVNDKYDSLLMNIILSGSNKSEVINLMSKELSKININGSLRNNIRAIINIINDEIFIKGNYYTDTLEKTKLEKDDYDLKVLEYIKSSLINSEKKMISKNNQVSYWRPSFWKGC